MEKDTLPEYERLDPSDITDPERSVAEWRKGVTEQLNRQAKLEANRDGSSKTLNKLLMFFGSTITAAALGMFVWAWNANATYHTRALEIRSNRERASENSERLEVYRDRNQELLNRVSGLDATNRAINRRLDRQGRQLEEILDQLQRGYNRRR